MTPESQAMRPEDKARPVGRLAEELSEGGYGALLAAVSGLGVPAALLLFFCAPLLRHLGGRVLLVMVIAAGVFSLAAFVCGVLACIRFRHRQTPAKIISWLAVPPAAFLLVITVIGASRIATAALSDTITDPEGRYSISRPDGDWMFLAQAISGENSEVEMVSTGGERIQVIVRTDVAGNNARQLLHEMSRLWTLPSMRKHHHHHHGEEAHEEKHVRRHDIRSIEITLGEETAAMLEEQYGEEIDRTAATLKAGRRKLERLIRSDAPADKIAKTRGAIEWYEALLEAMENYRQGGDLNSMVRRLASRGWPGDDAAYLAVRLQTPPLRIDGHRAVRLLVRGRNAVGEEFVQIVQFAVREGIAYTVECFAPAADETKAGDAFDKVIEGFRFHQKS